MTLKEIKNSVFLTECKDFILFGYSYSEPIMTKDNNGIVDNYLVFTVDFDNGNVDEPNAVFGIYTETLQVAYKKTIVFTKQQESFENSIDATKEDYQKYESLFFKVREFVFCECNAEQKKILGEYVSLLGKISGNGLMDLYKKHFPSFFDWYEKQK